MPTEMLLRPPPSRGPWLEFQGVHALELFRQCWVRHVTVAMSSVILFRGCLHLGARCEYIFSNVLQQHWFNHRLWLNIMFCTIYNNIYWKENCNIIGRFQQNCWRGVERVFGCLRTPCLRNPSKNSFWTISLSSFYNKSLGFFLCVHQLLIKTTLFIFGGTVLKPHSGNMFR